MMKKWRGYLIACVILVILAAALVASQMDLGRKEKPRVLQVSVIYRGNNQDESQQALKQGIDQAGSEFHAEITYLPMSNPGDVKEQAEMIQKETEHGADAILIEPLNDEVIKEEVNKTAESIPVIFINTDLNESVANVSAVHCDNQTLGRKLADKMREDNPKNQKVLFLRTGVNYSDTQSRYQGVKAVFDQNQIRYEEVILGGDDKHKEQLIRNIFYTTDAVQAVAFDSQVTEIAGKVKKDNPEYKNMKVYGFGKTNQMISYLEDEYLQQIGVPNEYSIGYVSVQNAVNLINGKTPEEKKIAYAVINKGNIYTAENQKLLFPFVQ